MEDILVVDVVLVVEDVLVGKYKVAAEDIPGAECILVADKIRAV